MSEKLVVGDLAIPKGEMKRGAIKGVELANNVAVDIPFLAMNGTEDGPTLLLMSTQHGIEVIHRVTRDDLVKMADAFGATTIISDRAPGEDAPPTLGNKASWKRVPVILEELIDGRWISEPSTSAGVRGVLNIMKAYDMIDGDVEPQEGFPIVPGVNRFHGVIRCARGGLIRFFKVPGEFFAEGEPLAEIYDLYGDVIEEVKMPVEGYVWAYPCGQSLGTSGGLQAVQSGANIAYAFTHESD